VGHAAEAGRGGNRGPAIVGSDGAGAQAEGRRNQPGHGAAQTARTPPTSLTFRVHSPSLLTHRRPSRSCQGGRPRRYWTFVSLAKDIGSAAPVATVGADYPRRAYARRCDVPSLPLALSDQHTGVAD